MTDPHRFEARTVLVTGAGSGIASATCERLHAEGASVIGLDRTDMTDHPLAGSDRFRPLVHDLIEPVPEDLFDQVGPVDVLVNAAGILHRSDVADHDLGEWQRTLAVNVRAPFLLTSLFVSHRTGLGGGGAVVNVCSIESFVAIPRHAAYTASKSAMLMFTRASAFELAAHGIRVNAIAPGVTATAMNRSLREDADASAALLRRIPLRRFGEPGDQAAAIAFLASDDAAYVTGTVLPVDGGWLTC
jgi:NAD(P)-dependent dehydrogenase (short-subunit alcohol dehydrogenase family)